MFQGEAMDFIPLIAAALGGSGIVGLASVLVSRRKIDAESRAVQVKGELEIVNVASELVATLRDEMDKFIS